jgi:hypothetical protein
MKKHAILSCLLLLSFWVNAQWQEITKYGKVTDFWYITENLQYIKADTSYIVEKGIPRIIPEWGFNKSLLADYDVWNPADFVKGTLVGFKRIQTGSYSPKVDIYKTRDGGITWEKFAYKDFGNIAILPILTAVDTQTVFLTHQYSDYHNNYTLPLIKVRKNKFEEIYSFGDTYPPLSELIAVTDTSTWYVRKYGPSVNKVFINKTKDGGKTWVMLDTNYFNYNNFIGKLHVRDEGVLLEYEIMNISYSIDSGQNWHLIERIDDPYKSLVIKTATMIGNKVFYIKGSYNNPDTPCFVLKTFDLISKTFDSVYINKHALNIESTLDNKCFIFNTTFYQNINPLQHPLNVNKTETIPKKTDQIYIYSNGDNLTIISKDKNTRNDILCIYDYTGKLLYSENLVIYEGNNVVSLSNMIIPGVYIVTITSNSDQYTKKMVKF